MIGAMRRIDAHTDVAVVGAGPIGLELAVALKRAGIDYLHFDAKQIGYTISWFAPGTRFFSSNERIAIAGVPLQTPDQSKCTREQYLAYLRSVVLQFDLRVNTYEPIVGIERPERRRDGRADGGFILTTRPAAGTRHVPRQAPGPLHRRHRPPPPARHPRRRPAARQPLLRRPAPLLPQTPAGGRREELRGRGRPALPRRRGRRLTQLPPAAAQPQEHQVLAAAGDQRACSSRGR